MQPDPLGHAVEVPETGIVRIRAKREDVMGISHEGYQATYFVAVSSDDSRKTLKYLTDVYRDKGIWWQGVISDAPEMARYDIGTETKGNFDHLPEHLRDERMIAARDGCRYRFINADEASKEAGYVEFLVISPNEREATSPWLWGDFGSYFNSLDEFASKVTEIQAKKAEYFRSISNDKQSQ